MKHPDFDEILLREDTTGQRPEEAEEEQEGGEENLRRLEEAMSHSQRVMEMLSQRFRNLAEDDDFLKGLEDLDGGDEDDSDEDGSDEDDSDEDVDEEIRRLEEALFPPSRMMKMLSSHYVGLDDGDDGDEDIGLSSADDYHNKAVDFARMGMYRKAAETCKQGLEKYPRNVDLLADMISYCVNGGDMEEAGNCFALLKERVPVHAWNWRAFSFSVDYLLADDPAAHEEECRTLVEAYKQTLPYEERALMAESQMEEALGNQERSVAVLEHAVKTMRNASQCALRLADIQMDRGLWQQAASTAAYGLAVSAESQPSINVSYLLLLRTLAKDRQLHWQQYQGKKVSAQEVEALSETYDSLMEKFPRLSHYRDTMEVRRKMLEFLETD